MKTRHVTLLGPRGGRAREREKWRTRKKDRFRSDYLASQRKHSRSLALSRLGQRDAESSITRASSTSWTRNPERERPRRSERVGVPELLHSTLHPLILPNLRAFVLLRGTPFRVPKCHLGVCLNDNEGESGLPSYLEKRIFSWYESLGRWKTHPREIGRFSGCWVRCQRSR